MFCLKKKIYLDVIRFLINVLCIYDNVEFLKDFFFLNSMFKIFVRTILKNNFIIFFGNTSPIGTLNDLNLDYLQIFLKNNYSSYL